MEAGRKLMVRLFYAVEVDEDIKASLRPGLNAMSSLGRHVRTVKPTGMHITLLFLGEQPKEVVTDFVSFGKDAVSMARPCTLQIGTPGFFPSVSYLTLTGEIETLVMISSMLKETCSGYLERPDTRPFKAHLTLARHKQKIAGKEKDIILREFKGIEGSSWEVDELVLYKSDLTPKGAIYTDLGRFKFGS